MKRYFLAKFGYSAKMQEHPNGDYVRHEDCAELQRQLAAVTAELDHFKRATGWKPFADYGKGILG